MAIDAERAAGTALRLLDEHGLEKLTVRRVASELGVKAPALYWHFENKRALLDQMTHAMVAPVTAGMGRPEAAGLRQSWQPWQQWLEVALGALRRALLAHRDGARVASGADVTRALALGGFVERVTEVLHDAGFGLGDASRASGALVHFVIGRAVEEQSRPAPDVELAAVSEVPFPFPTLARALRERHTSGATADDDFRFSLSIMLTGLRVLRGQQRPADDPVAPARRPRP